MAGDRRGITGDFMKIQQPAGCPHCGATSVLQLRRYADAVARAAPGMAVAGVPDRDACLTWRWGACGGQFEQRAAVLE